MRNALITIGITCYQEREYLRECWESVLAQTDDRWEVVLVLDGGADELTEKIFHEIQHGRVRKQKNGENAGPYANRSRAIEMAETEWYFQLDADDRLPKRSIESILDSIKRDPTADFVFGDCLYFGRGTVDLQKIAHFEPEKLVQGLLPVITGTSPVRIAAYYDVGGFAKELFRGGADWDFWISMAEKGKSGARANHPIYERRQRNHSVSTGWQTRRDEVAKVLIDRHPLFFSVNNRRALCLYHANMRMARLHKAQGNRDKAAEYARGAMKYGDSVPAIQEILKESEMSWPSYRIRRLARQVGNRFANLRLPY